MKIRDELKSLGITIAVMIITGVVIFIIPVITAIASVVIPLTLIFLIVREFLKPEPPEDDS